MKTERYEISTDFIRLDAFLKLTGAVMSGGQAKAWIQEGHVTVNREICTQRGKKLRPGDVVGVEGAEIIFEVGSESGQSGVIYGGSKS